jgi:hypothetical protein
MLNSVDSRHVPTITTATGDVVIKSHRGQYVETRENEIKNF